MHDAPEAPAPSPTGSAPHDPTGFSFVLGGPLFRLYRRCHLSNDALGLLGRRVVVIVLVTWLPLLVLSAMAGQAWGPSGAEPTPFLRDLAAQIRALVALPLLIIAELMVHERIRPLVRQFRTGQLIPASASQEFDDAVASAERLRSSITAEVAILMFVYVVFIQIVWRHNSIVDVSSWFATASSSGKQLTAAGYWYGYVSLPIFQFLLCRWYFRLFIWIRFLKRVSRIDLNIIPTHPDRTGGLAFLSLSVIAFLPLIVAHGVLLSAVIANAILYGGAMLTDFKIPIAILVIVIAGVMFGPLMVFAPQLGRAKRKAIFEYGALGQQYVREFDRKWIRGEAPQDEPLIGSADLQSLADLGNSFQTVMSMTWAPVNRGVVIMVVVVTLLPLLPLILTMMPLSAALKLLMGMGM